MDNSFKVYKCRHYGRKVGQARCGKEQPVGTCWFPSTALLEATLGLRTPVHPEPWSRTRKWARRKPGLPVRRCRRRCVHRAGIPGAKRTGAKTLPNSVAVAEDYQQENQIVEKEGRQLQQALQLSRWRWASPQSRASAIPSPDAKRPDLRQPSA